MMPGGGCKQYKDATIDIRWYSTNKSLTIKGLECDDLKTRLRALASEIYEEQSSEDDVNSIELVNISDTDSISTILPNVLCDKCSELAERVEVLEERMNKNLSELSKSINSLKAKEELETELSREYVDFIVRENAKLKHDNEQLRERAENLSYIMSDLNTKVKGLENEKESLVTALGMLQSDLNEKYKATNWHIVKGPVKKTGSCHGCKPASASSRDANIDSSIETSNRFESLIYEGDEEFDNQEIPNKTKTMEKLNHQQKDIGKKQRSSSDDKDANLNAQAKRPTTESQQINWEQKQCTESN